MTSQPQNEIPAAEAARLLGVKLPTLYAYVSRGLLRSLPGRGGRARRYLRSDVEALRERGPSVRAAAGALRWGEPILESSITAMTPDGPA
jgi:citrate synthase